MIYAYGICEPAAGAPPARRGLGGSMLRSLELDGIAVVYSRHRSLQPRPEPELVLQHERVVEAIMARGPVLPLRFGTLLDSEQSLADAVSGRRNELRQALERVRGRMELGLRVFPRDPAPTEPEVTRASGREYLLARAAEHRRTERAARELHAPLSELAEASVLREAPRPPAILVASYLVDARQADSLRSRARELAGRHPDLDVVVSGPWPPYSFATQEPE